MQKNKSRATALLLLVTLLFPIAACGAEADPHEGMIYVNTGTDCQWVYPAEDVAVSAFAQEDFASDGNIVTYTGDEYETMLGVDVSFYQGEIDWQAVKDDGVDFAMIRCGFRGATEGNMYEDEMFRQNIEGALAAGLRVGVYFFSQSTGAVEAAEDAQFVLGLIEEYDVTMPVAFDWEPLDDSRAEDILMDELTGAAMVFCEMVKDAGYESAVYFYRKLAYYDYDLTRLKDYTFWIGAPGEWPDFYYDFGIWQFSFTGNIDGIETDVDLNLYFKKLVTSETTEE